MENKIIKLIKKPRQEYIKILPYLKTKLQIKKRGLLEFIGNDTISKPYSGHDKLLKYINFDNGFFIEAGGNDGYAFDPTYYLEKFKRWKGIIIEPLPIYKTCQKFRKKSKVYNHALVSSDYKNDKIELLNCNLMSVIKGSQNDNEDFIKKGEDAQKITAKKIEVKARTLQWTIDDYFSKNKKRNIDFLVLDTEGHELEDLKGLNFVKNPPRFILIEIQNRENDEIDEYLKNKNYKYIDQIDNKDYLYAKTI